MLGAYGTLENLYKEIENDSEKAKTIPKKQKANLIEFKKDALKAKEHKTYVKEELDKALKDGFQADEISAARQGWMQNREIGRAKETELANRLASYLLIDRTLLFDTDTEKKVAVLNNEQILTVLRKYFDPAKLSIVKAGDFKNASQSKN